LQNPLEYLLPRAQDERLQVFRQFAAEALVLFAHRRALERSTNEWLGVITSAELPRANPPALAGARPVSVSGPNQSASLVEPAAQVVYPDASRRGGEFGEVTLTLRVAEDGRVIAVDVDRSSGFGDLDDAARLTMLRWKFTPAQRDGTPVTSYVRAAASFAVSTGSAPRATLRVVGG
jgi:TonB family protein